MIELGRETASCTVVEEAPPVCTIGEEKCEGPDLYSCQMVGGSPAWVLYIRNSPKCGYVPPEPPPEPTYVIVNGWTIKLMCDTLTPQTCVASVPDEVLTTLHSLCPISIRDYIQEKFGIWEIQIYPEWWDPKTKKYTSGVGRGSATTTHCWISGWDAPTLLHEIGHGLDYALGHISHMTEWHTIVDQTWGSRAGTTWYSEHWAKTVGRMLSGWRSPTDGRTYREWYPVACDFADSVIRDPWGYIPPEPPPAELILSNLRIEPAISHYVNDTVSISVDAKNPGATLLSEDVVISYFLASALIGVNKKPVTLNPGQQTTLIWNYKSYPKYGTFTVKIGDLSGTFITTRT